MDRQIGLTHLRNARIVEFGGAASRFLLDFALYVHAHVTAVDFSPVGIEATRLLFGQYGIQGEAVHADMFSWDIEPGSFDVVTHWGLLEHFTDPEPVLAASARVVRKDGWVVFTMPNMMAAGASLWRRYAPENYSKHVLHSDKDVADACARVGLQLKSVFYSGPPLLRMAPLEKAGVGPVPINIGHAVLLVIGTLAPSLYVHGHSALSNTRGFVARRAYSRCPDLSAVFLTDSLHGLLILSCVA